MYSTARLSTAIWVCFLLLAGCGKTPPRHVAEKLAKQDSGVTAIAKDAAVPLPDSGLSSPDSGTPLNPDSGIMPPTDCDDNPNSCAPRELRSSAPECRCLNRCEEGWEWDDRTRSCVEACESTIIPPYPPPAPCAYRTLECLFACDSQECQDECFDREPNQEPCFECINQNYLSCVNRRGCQAAYDAVICCRAANCPDDPFECNGICNRQEREYEDCIGRQVERCQEQLITCFQMEQ